MHKEFKYIKSLIILILIGITILIGGSLIWNIQKENTSANDYALIEAKASYNKDLIYRLWASMHGGIYVPVTTQSPPNPYLAFLPERDIVTTTGKKLTLINPAYMTRQVFAIAEKEYGVKGHITSLNPIRPENKADAWETKALKRFDKGESEYFSIEDIDNQKYMRFMGAMKVEENCLKCHSNEGYKIGENRGGISVSVPMDKYDQIASSSINNLIITHICIYLAIIFLLIIGYKQFLKRVNEQAFLQKKVIESEKAYKDVIETTSDLITTVDKDGKFIYVNHASIHFFNLPPKECIGKMAFDFIHPEDKEYTKSKFLEWENSENTAFYFENRQVNLLGKILDVAWNIHIERKNNEVVKITSIGRDVTDRKINDQLLKEKNEEIDSQNKEYIYVNKELNKLISDLSNVNDELTATKEEVEKNNNKLLQLNADKTRFISILGHDLRNLFNTILGFTELLLKKTKVRELDKIENYANQINITTITAFNLLEDLLTWANAQSNKLAFNPQKLSLKNIYSEALEALKYGAIEKNITINYVPNDDLIVCADNYMLKTILRNLISNAIKFTRPGGTITINVNINTNDLLISVTDNGIGMTLKEKNSLFDVSKTHTTPGTANERGTGLGLLLCKEFVDKHGGKIWVESESGKGSEFKFTVPQPDV